MQWGSLRIQVMIMSDSPTCAVPATGGAARALASQASLHVLGVYLGKPLLFEAIQRGNDHMSQAMHTRGSADHAGWLDPHGHALNGRPT